MTPRWSGGRWSGGRWASRGATVLATMFLAVVLAACGGHGSHLAGAATSGPCSKPDPANPVFSHTAANHIVDTKGRVMVPSGITVYGLAVPTWQQEGSVDDAQIRAAITQWCSSYVRLQVAPALLLSSQPYDSAYLAAVKAEVSLAESYGANVVLTAQTERTSNQPSADPTQQTVTFWQTLAPLYRHDPRVWFDLFNEPRLTTTPAQLWSVWRKGGTVDGVSYVGMQPLADDVRAAAGTTNLILVEGPNHSENFAKLLQHQIVGRNIAYAAHAYGETNEQAWTARFGNAAARLPVIVDEWGEYDRNNSSNGQECSGSAATFVPQFFQFLRKRQIGLGAWALIPGVLVTNTTSFTPTTIGAGYNCRIAGSQSSTMTADQNENGTAAVPEAQGVGQLLKSYFTAQRLSRA